MSEEWGDKISSSPHFLFAQEFALRETPGNSNQTTAKQ